MVETIVDFTGRVESLEQERIPEILLATLVSDDGRIRVMMDWHKELFVLPEGARLRFRVTRDIPDYRDGVDFLGRATVVKVKEEEGKWRHLLSIGGLLVVIETGERLPLNPLDKVYVHIQPL